jgi:hypothetical protein
MVLYGVVILLNSFTFSRERERAAKKIGADISTAECGEHERY